MSRVVSSLVGILKWWTIGWSGRMQRSLRIGRKVELPVFFTFIEEASNNFLEKVHPLHKGGRKAADEVVLASTLEPV